jgi:hypothetical protein
VFTLPSDYFQLNVTIFEPDNPIQAACLHW